MGYVSGFVVYAITWWTVLLAIMPFGVKTDPDTGQIGAPMKPLLLKKAIATTLVSAVIWVVIFLLIRDPNFLPFSQMAAEEIQRQAP